MVDMIIPRCSGRLAVLELGCGRHRNAHIERFRHAEPLVVKVDRNVDDLRALHFLEQGASAAYIAADAQALPFADGSFNVILWRNLLDFIPEMDSRGLSVEENISRIERGRALFFAGIFRVLAPGGIVISDDIADTDGLYAYKGPLAVDLRSFSARTDLAASARAAGFEVLERDIISGLSMFRKPLSAPVVE